MTKISFPKEIKLEVVKTVLPVNKVQLKANFKLIWKFQANLKNALKLQESDDNINLRSYIKDLQLNITNIRAHIRKSQSKSAVKSLYVNFPKFDKRIPYALNGEAVYAKIKKRIIEDLIILKKERDSLVFKKTFNIAHRLNTDLFYMGSWNTNRVIGVFLEKNSILKLLKAKKSQGILNHNKYPKTPEKHIGIEIECFLPKTCSEIDLANAFYDSGLADNIHIKGDSSIKPPSDDFWPAEVTFMCTEDVIETKLSLLCAVLSTFGAQVNKTCGLHVHLDMRNLNKSERFIIANNFLKAQNLMFLMISKSRQNNEYCKKATRSSITKCRDKYRAINTCAFFSHNTLEIRCHGGTVEYTKILNWVFILQSIRNNSITRAPKVLNSWQKLLKWSDSLKNYVQSRINLFGNAKNDEEEIESEAA